jgi:hypothetical protein
MTENSLINLGELSRPATVLVEKISDAVGGIFKPYQIVRIARAEAAAEVIRKESEIQVTDLHRRAMHRFLTEEANKQSNIEGITQKALPLIGEKASPEKVENDWITNFFDKCRIISDQDMQSLWSRVLAQEANSPGAFSRKTVNLLSDLDKSDAELFTRFCGFAWAMGGVVPLIFDVQDEIYNRQGINFGSLTHLNDLGLVLFQNLAGFVKIKLPRVSKIFYYGRSIELTLPADADNSLDVGKVLLTRAGEQLAPVCGSSPVAGFFDFVYDRWARQLYVPMRPAEDGIPIK